MSHSNANLKQPNEIRSIWRLFLVIQKGFEPFECKMNHLNEIRRIRMQNLTIRKGSKAFECKFKPFDRDSKHSSNVNSNHSKGFEAIECKFKLFKLIESIRMQIWSIRMQIWTSQRFKPFEWKFEAFEQDSKHSNVYSNIETDSNQIRALRTRFEAFEWIF